MINFLYNIIIFPLVQVFDLCYTFFYRTFENHGISIIGVSLAVSILTLPLYFEAEKWQNIERVIREKLSAKTAKIKAIFRGDERYMILSTYYRQNNYHPVYSLRSSIGLFLQIPFFIAAYTYLSKLDTIIGVSFMGISNLGTPDELLKIGIKNNIFITVNVLPILMTLFNITSSVFYLNNIKTTLHSNKEKLQLFGVAFIFLILLYNSPSSLVLYWTFNNMFSLIKNILQKIKYSRLILLIISCLSGFLLVVFILFFHHGDNFKRFLVALVGISLIFLPLYKKYNKHTLKDKLLLLNKDTAINNTSTIVFSSFILFILTGIVIPSSLIASSVNEFSFIEHYTSPFPFIFHTMEQAFGFFVFWVLCIYFLLQKNKKYFLTASVTVIAILGLVNTFVFSGNYGPITINLNFASKHVFTPSFIFLLTNIIVLLSAIGLSLFLLFYRKKQIIQFFQIIILIALFTVGIFNMSRIFIDFKSINIHKNTELDSLALNPSSDIQNNNGYTPFYEFSKTGKNVLIIMLDRGISGYVPYIFDEKPELIDQFSGFTFFPNTISFGSHTLYGAPPLFGGYEYSPLEINARINEDLIPKYNESFLILPKLFLSNNYKVTITDPPLYNENIQNLFLNYPEIKAANLANNYTDDWLKNHPDVQLLSISNLLNNKLIYLSFLKFSPVFFRKLIYDNGRWLSAENGNTPLETIESYSLLDILPEITTIMNKEFNTLTLMVNILPHEPAFLQSPDYTIPPVYSTNKGNGHFATNYHYHVNIASFVLLGKYFMFLKDNGVYDNTRIIIVSDHGINSYSDFENNIILPNGECLQSYAALLLFKDFNAQDFTVNNQFMVNADTPILAYQDIILNPINPFTGKKIIANKDNGVTITTAPFFSKPHYQNRLNIAPNEWLHVQDSIFEPKNWKKVRIE